MQPLTRLNLTADEMLSLIPELSRIPVTGQRTFLRRALLECEGIASVQAVTDYLASQSTEDLLSLLRGVLCDEDVKDLARDYEPID